MFKRRTEKIAAQSKAAYNRRMKEIDDRMKATEARNENEREQIRKDVERRARANSWLSTGVPLD